MRLAGNIMYMGEVRNAHNILAGKPEGKRLLDSPEHRQEDVDLKEIVYVRMWSGFIWLWILHCSLFL